MTKINHEEYEVLKSLRDSWRWIARDNDTILWVYEKEPRKHGYRWDDLSGVHGYYWDEPSGVCESVDSDSFQFIQWGDENPFSIAELIEEYEKDYKGSWEHVIEFSKELRRESEGTEVKKDKKGLVKYLEKEISNFKPGQMIYDYLTFILNQVNQLDELETLSIDKEQLVERIENYIPLHDKTVGDVVDGILEIVKQLPETEVLSLDWIDGHKEGIAWSNTDTDTSEVTYYIKEEDLQNLLVPKREKPVIPQFVADYIEEYKGWNDDEEFYDEDNAIDLFGAMDLDNAGMSDKVHDYLVDNQETFARAWLDGYEVEEEPKYYLKIGNLYLAEPLGDMTSDIVRMTRDKGVAYQFTDEKSIATHLDKFEGVEAVKAKELE